MPLGRCVGKPGAGSSPAEPDEPRAALYAVVCPAGHEGGRPVVVVDLSAAEDLGWELFCMTDACCPACPGERLMPSWHVPEAGGRAGECRCCLAVWRPGTVTSGGRCK